MTTLATVYLRLPRSHFNSRLNNIPSKLNNRKKSVHWLVLLKLILANFLSRHTLNPTSERNAIISNQDPQDHNLGRLGKNTSRQSVVYHLQSYLLMVPVAYVSES